MSYTHKLLASVLACVVTICASPRPAVAAYHGTTTPVSKGGTGSTSLNGAGIAQLGLTPVFTVPVSIADASGSAEVNLTLSAADAGGSTVFGNTTSSATVWAPLGLFTATTTSGSLLAFAAATDTGSAALATFRSRINTNSAVSVRPLFSFQNNSTPVLNLDARGCVQLTPIAASSSVWPMATWTAAANTGRTASTEVIDFNVNTSATQTWAPAALTTQRNMVVQAPTYAFSSSTATISDAATLAVTGAPIAGANATITRSSALWVQAGLTRAAGGLSIGDGATITKVLSSTATLDFPDTATSASSDLTITVTGAADGDVVQIATPNASVPAGAHNFRGWVSGANTVTIRFSNNSGGNLNPASGTFRAAVTQF